MSQIDNVVLGAHSLFAFTSDSLTPAATNANLAAEQAFTLTTQPSTLVAGDAVFVTSNVASANSVTAAQARINSTGQLVIKFVNPTAGSLTHAAGTFTVLVARP